MQKLSPKILTTIVLATIILAAFPMIVSASTGHPQLAAIDSLTAPTAIVDVPKNVSIQAGSSAVAKINNVAATGYLAIVFYNNTDLVTFSGSQFNLIMSKDGFASQSADDLTYAAQFAVSDLDATYPVSVTRTSSYLKTGSAQFSLGTVTIAGNVYKILVGPIPYDIIADYKYIKIFDGTSTSLAVSEATIDVLPAISLIPNSGPGGRGVTLSGVALQASKVLNLTYGVTSANTNVFANPPTGADGKFSYSWNINDTKAEFASAGPNTPAAIPSDGVTIGVWYNVTGATLIDSQIYQESRRAFTRVVGTNTVSTTLPNGFGNNSITVNVNSGSTLTVVGYYFNPTADITFVTESITLATVSASSIRTDNGNFSASMTIPDLSIGNHIVRVTNNGVVYVFTINVLPTLTLTPNSGKVDTIVTATCVGFPANTAIYLYWNEILLGEQKLYWAVNATTGSDGKFNVTATFKVPHAYGGVHQVLALTAYGGATITYTGEGLPSPFTNEVSRAGFTINPTLTMPSPIGNDGTTAIAIGNGFQPGTTYAVDIDNQFLQPSLVSTVTANNVGDLNVTIVAAGFQAGLHVLALYTAPTTAGVYAPAGFALFNVTTIGDYTATTVTQINSTVNGLASGGGQDTLLIQQILANTVTLKTDTGIIKANLTQILAWQPTIVGISNGVAQIQTTLGTMTATLSSIQSTLTGVSGGIASIQTSIGTIDADLSAINAKVTSIDGKVATIETDVGTIKGTVTSTDGKVATIQTDIGTLQTSVDNVQTSVDAVPGKVNIPIYIALVLALVAAIASVMCLIMMRRKIAG